MDAKTFRVADDSNYSENARVLDETVAVNQFQAYSKGNVTYLSRADGFANYAEATAAPSDDMYVMDDETREAITEKSVARYDSMKINSGTYTVRSQQAHLLMMLELLKNLNSGLWVQHRKVKRLNKLNRQ